MSQNPLKKPNSFIRKFTGLQKLDALRERRAEKNLQLEILDTSYRCHTFKKIVSEACESQLIELCKEYGQGCELCDDIEQSTKAERESLPPYYMEAMTKDRYSWQGKRADRPASSNEHAAYKIEAMFLAQQREAENKLFDAQLEAALFGLVILAPTVVSIYLIAKAIITQL